MNKQLFKIADIVTAHLQDMKSIGLTEGKMGLVLFYYEFSRYLSLEIDNHLANNLLDEVLSKAGKVGNNGIELWLGNKLSYS